MKEDVGPKDVLVIVASQNPRQIAGSVQAECECGTIIWVPQSTDRVRKAREGLPVRLLCIPCFAKDMKERAGKP